MIKKITAVILSVLGIFLFGKFKGKQNEKNKQNKEVIKKIRATRKRRLSRSNDTPTDSLKWLQEHNTD